MAQSLLHHGEHILIAAAFGIEQPLRTQAYLGKCRGKEIAPAQRPEHRPAASRSSRGEGC